MRVGMNPRTFGRPGIEVRRGYRAVVRHEDLARDIVRTAGAGHAGVVPGVDHLHIGNRHQEGSVAVPGLAAHLHPVSVHDPRSPGGAPADFPAAIDLARFHVGGARRWQQDIAPGAEQQLLRGFGELRDIGVVGDVEGRDPPGGGAGGGDELHHLHHRRKAGFRSAPAARHEHLDQLGIDHVADRIVMRAAQLRRLRCARLDARGDIAGTLDQFGIAGRHRLLPVSLLPQSMGIKYPIV